MSKLLKPYPIAACIAVIGLIFLALQTVNGFDGYVGPYAWGIYIAFFFAAAGGGAGLMIIVGLGVLGGKIENGKQGYLASLAMLVSAGCLIFADLGSPAAIFHMLASPNFAAPMNADAVMLALAILVCFLAAVFGGRSKQNERLFAALAVIAALLLLAVESWLVAVSARQELWSVMLGAAPAFMQAFVVGFAVLLFFQSDKGAFWRKALLASMGVLLSVQIIDVFAGMGNMTHLGQQYSTLFSSGVFWLAEAALLAAIALAVFSLREENAALAAKSAALVAMFSVAVGKLAILWAGQSVAALSQLEHGLKPHLAATEVVIVVGMLALGVVVYGIADRLAKNLIQAKGVASR